MEISHANLDSLLKPPKGFAPVYLIHGDELLYKEAFARLLNAMVPREQQGLNYEPFDGRDASASAVAAGLATYPMFPGTKVVAWHDSRVFYSQKETMALLEKAKQAHDQPDMEKASRFVLDFLSMNKVDLADLNPADPAAGLNLSAEQADYAGPWLSEILAHCLKENKKIPEFVDEGEIIVQVLEKGCRDNHLIITADLVDKRKKLYKFINEIGVVVDCAVPKGVLKADKDAQSAALKVQADRILSQRGKTMEPRALAALQDRIGADLRGFSNSLDKLCSYVGDRPAITVRDVEILVERTKEDPIFEFTGALAGKNALQALLHLDRLLEGDFHPLAVLAASANHFRRFLTIKAFLASPRGSRWKKGMNFNSFKADVMPAIAQHDEGLAAVLAAWETQLVPGDEEAPEKPGGKKAKKAGKQFSTDLLIAPKGRNPYPIYLAFKESDRFSGPELLSALNSFIQADREIKSTPPKFAKIIMERVILSICGGGG